MRKRFVLVTALVALSLAQLVAAQVLVTALPVNPTSLDPHRAIEGYSFMVTNALYDTLVRRGPDGAFEPGLAVAWSRPEPTVLRLELRRGVTFHDGHPLDAETVAASLRRLVDPATGARGSFLLTAVSAIEVIDAHTLDLVNDPPFVPLLANLGFPATAIVPIGAGAALGRAPIGTGPFRFVAWREGEVVELEANPDYWGGAPALAGVRYLVMPERAAQLIAFRAGDLHLIHDLSPDAYHALEGMPGVELVRYPSDRTTYLGFNLEQPLVQDDRVRRAIAHAIDRELLVEALFRGLALPPAGPLSPLVRFALGEPDPYVFDPERARALLLEAGAAGASLTLDLATDGDLDDVATYVQAALGDVGLRVELRRNDFPTFFDRLQTGAHALDIGFWGSDTLDPDFMLSIALHSREVGSNNSSRYVNEAFDELIERAAASDDDAQRAALYVEAQRLAMTDLPLLPLYHHVGTYAARSEVQGLRVLASSFQIDFRAARLDRDEAAPSGR